MRRPRNWTFTFGFLLLLCIVAAPAQSGGNIIYGDLRIDASRATEKVPNTFYVLLTSGSSLSGERQAVPPGGRFRFVNVPNGEYDLVVELDGREVARTRIIVQPPTPTDFRYDLDLAWTDTVSQDKRPATVSALYNRTKTQQKLFDEAAAEKSDDRAIELLRQIVKNDAKDFVAWTDLGTRLFRQKSETEAAAAFQHAIDEKGDYLLALLNLGKLELAGKDYEKAVATLDKAVAAHPSSPEANYLLGEAYLDIKKGSKAVIYFNEALRLAPVEMADAHLRLALLYNAAGYKDRAAVEYEMFLAKRPDFKDKEKLEQYIKVNKKS